MTELQAVALYAGLNLALLIALTVMVILNRRRAGVSLGSGRDRQLEQACRAHGNATETIPVMLIGLGLLAWLETPILHIHAVGAALTLGRYVHALGLVQNYGPSFARLTGMCLTLISMIAMVLMLLSAAIS